MTETPKTEAPKKLPYKKPTLIKLGTLRQMTLAVGNSGGMDSATGPTKTST